MSEGDGLRNTTLYRWLHQINDTSHTRIPANKTPLEIAVLIWEITKSNIDWGRVQCQDRGIKARFFLHDNDACYSEGFDVLLKSAGLKPVKTPYQAPNANAFAERWIRSLREECLNHLVILGLNRLQHMLDEYKDFFNHHRPHQGIGNEIPGQSNHQVSGQVRTASQRRFRPDDIQCQLFLGGLLKSYSRRAA